MSKEVTTEQIQKLEDIFKALKGTRHHARYSMCCEVKLDNGKWDVCGWGVPRMCSGFNGAYIKTVRDVSYIYCQEGYAEYGFRYQINKEVADLFGWEV